MRTKAFLTIVWFTMCVALMLPLAGAYATDEGREPTRAEDFPCFPPPDRRNCEIREVSRLAQAIKDVIRDCYAQYGGEQEKYAMIGAIAAGGPHMMAIAAEILAAEIKDDVLKCVTKGVLPLFIDDEDERKRLKKDIEAAYETRSAWNFLKDAQNARLMQRWESELKKFYDSSLYESFQRYKSLEAFEEMWEARSPVSKAYDLLQKATAAKDNCEFDQAASLFDQTRKATELYCETSGSQYRRMERALRCYREQYRRFLEPGMEDTPQAQQYERTRRSLETKHESLSEHLVRLYTGLGEGQRTLAAWRAWFEEAKPRHDAMVDSAKRWLAGQNMQSACPPVKFAKDAEEAARTRSESCRQKMGTEADALERELNKQANGLAAYIEELLRDATVAIADRACDDVKTKFAAVDGLADRVWILKDDRCEHVLPDQVKASLDFLKQQLKRLEEYTKYVQDLLDYAARQAGHVCYYDQALTGQTAEDRIQEMARKGCREKEDVESRLKQIREAKDTTQKRVDKARNDLFGALVNATKEVDPNVPRCEVDAARGSLAEAERLYKEIGCENVTPLPSQAIQDFARRARTGTDAAKFAVDDRAAYIEKARGEYEETLRQATIKTDDPCTFKQALDAASRLEGLAKDFCQPGKAAEDLAGIRTEVQKMEARIQQDLQALDQAVAEVERENDCAAAESIGDTQHSRVVYLYRCAEFQARIDAAFNRMRASIDDKRKRAAQGAQQLVTLGQQSINRCENLEQITAQIENNRRSISASCMSPESVQALDVTLANMQGLIDDLNKRRATIERLKREAANLQTECKFVEAYSRVESAWQSLPSEPCYSRYLFGASASELKALAAAISKGSLTFSSMRAEILLHVSMAEDLRKARVENQEQDRTRIKHYKEERDKTSAAIQDARSSGFSQCIGEFVARFNALPATISSDTGRGGLPAFTAGGEVSGREMDRVASGSTSRSSDDARKPEGSQQRRAGFTAGEEISGTNLDRIAGLIGTASPEDWGRKPSPPSTPQPPTPKPPAPTKTAPAPSKTDQYRADCSALRKQYHKQCQDMAGYYAEENCRKGRNYSGCALDAVGCLAAYIEAALPDDLCARPGYVGCARGALDQYLGCLKNCNVKSINGQLPEGLLNCRLDCQNKVDTATKSCKAR
jgi:hypothetical protein